MRTRFSALLCATPALLSACRSPVPVQVLSKPVPVVPRSQAPATRGPWAFRPATQQRTYVVEQRATLTIRQDTVTRLDTVASRAELTFATLLLPSYRVSGTVRAFRVQSGGHAAATPAGLAVPFAFTAAYPAQGRQLEFDAPAQGAPCSSPSLAVAQSLRDLWFRAPDTLRVGSRWGDSTSFISCRDGLPLQTAVRRTFHVTDAAEQDGRLVLTLRRLSHSTLEGQGAQAGEPVGVAGEGGGELTYTVDPASGEILAAQGSAVLEFTFRSRSRTQSVRQTGEIQVARGA